MSSGSSKRTSLRFSFENWWNPNNSRKPNEEVMTVVHLGSKIELSHEFWLIEVHLAEVVVRTVVESP